MAGRVRAMRNAMYALAVAATSLVLLGCGGDDKPTKLTDAQAAVMLNMETKALQLCNTYSDVLDATADPDFASIARTKITKAVGELTPAMDSYVTLLRTSPNLKDKRGLTVRDHAVDLITGTDMDCPVAKDDRAKIKAILDNLPAN